MSATGADPQSERTLPRETQAWGLVRRTLPLGKSIGSLGHLISVGLIASWIIAVFFGASLLCLVPRSATLVTGSSEGSDRFNASSAEIPWLYQSTDRLHRLAGPLLFEPGQPAGGTGMVNDGAVGPESRVTAGANQRPIPVESISPGTSDEPQNQALSVTALSEEPSPAAPPENRAAATAGSPIALHAAQFEISRTKHNQKAATNKVPPPHPPVQAIQDVLHRHAGLLK